MEHICVKKIKVNNLFHLHDFDIEFGSEDTPHLILTGRNGSGKTILLNAISDFLDQIKADKHLYFLKYGDWVEFRKKKYEEAKTDQDKASAKTDFDQVQKQYDDLYAKVSLEFSSVYDLVQKYNDGDFIVAFYQATRKVSMLAPKNPTKPQYAIKSTNKDIVAKEFLNFMSDLKIQEALARNENNIADADEIRLWFENFESLLREIYNEPSLKLQFDYKDYSFKINIVESNKSFTFNQMSDGYSAVFEIIVDLILKMQDKKSVVRSYQKEGIVLIDEIETHLHLELQKNILPLLTKIFPNIQFIVTTHSPFVLNSLSNAVAFDLEHQEEIRDLDEYSYSTLAEEYFGVSTDSNILKIKLDELKRLCDLNYVSKADQERMKKLISEFNEMPNLGSSMLLAEYHQLLLSRSSRLKELGVL